MNPLSFAVGKNLTKSFNVNAFVKKENNNIVTLNKDRIVEFVTNQTSKLIPNKDGVRLDKVDHIIFDYEKNECEFYMTYYVTNSKGKEKKYKSLYNKVKITDQ
jgi:hypothetical protein